MYIFKPILTRFHALYGFLHINGRVYAQKKLCLLAASQDEHSLMYMDTIHQAQLIG